MATRETISEAPANSGKACSHHLLQEYRPEPGCKCGKLRGYRKLHTLFGLWLALFVSAHLAICLSGLDPLRYQSTVGWIHGRLAHVPGGLLMPVFVPLFVQAASGLFLARKEGLRYDIKRCDRGGKLRFFLQRISGLAILVFLLVHVGRMHGWGLPLLYRLTHADVLARYAGGGSFAADGAAFASTVSAFHPWASPSGNFVIMAFLLLGIWATVFHAANGATSGAPLWKIVETPQGKSRLKYTCVGIGMALAVIGSVAWYAFSLSPNVHATLPQLALR